MARRRGGAGFGLGAALALALCAPGGAALAAPACGNALERAVVASVGQRLDVALADGRQVRFGGLDPPDPARGDSHTPARARAFLSRWLAGGTVGLCVLSARTDRWGRVVGELFAPPVGAPQGAPISVSLALLGAGWARVWPEREVRARLADFLAAEAGARARGLGLWGDPYYAVVAAADLEKLRERDGQFTLVEGVVARVGESGSRYYVDFSLHRGFTIVIPKRRTNIFQRAGIAIPELRGWSVRVRGAVDDRFGPRIEIFDPDSMERPGASDGAREATPGQ